MPATRTRKYLIALAASAAGLLLGSSSALAQLTLIGPTNPAPFRPVVPQIEMPRPGVISVIDRPAPVFATPGAGNGPTVVGAPSIPIATPGTISLSIPSGLNLTGSPYGSGYPSPLGQPGAVGYPGSTRPTPALSNGAVQYPNPSVTQHRGPNGYSELYHTPTHSTVTPHVPPPVVHNTPSGVHITPPTLHTPRGTFRP